MAGKTRSKTMTRNLTRSWAVRKPAESAVLREAERVVHEFPARERSQLEGQCK